MDPRLQRRVQRYGWDKASSVYEQYWAQQLAPAQEHLLETAALEPGEQVLDVACGTGLVTLPAAEAVGATGSVRATDLSDGMVALVTGAAAEAGLDNVTAERMDAENLRFEDGTFDAVLCALGLMYVPDPRQSLTEARRVLKPGGRAVMAVWGARDCCGWAEIFPIVDRRVESEVCPLFFQLGTGNALGMVMEMAGFEDVTADRISTTLEYETAEDACGAAFAGGPVAMAYHRFDDATREETHAEYLASISQWKDGEGYRVPGEFVIVSGHRA